MPEDHLEHIQECPDCASQNIVHGAMREQIICRDCGLIFEPLAPATAARAAFAKKVKKPAEKTKAKKKSKPKKAKPKKGKAGKKAKPARKKKCSWW